MLEVADLHAYYGKSHILQGVDMHIDCLLYTSPSPRD